MLEQYLKQCKIENPKEWIDSPNTALVLVNGEIPVGTRRGDRIHVEITLPPGSKARSLRGGYLVETNLMTYASMNQVRTLVEQNTEYKPVSTGDGLLKGHIVATAEGPLQISLNDKDSTRAAKSIDTTENGVRRAWVWKGARTRTEQPIYVVLNPDQKSHRKSTLIADRINETFHGPGSPEKIAIARTSDSVVMSVPPQYRGNVPHFLRVVRAIPQQRPIDGSDYHRRLMEQLKQPETTLSAALRLEALGRGSVKPLRETMQVSPFPLVRYASAEALAYLGEPIAANELAKLAETHPSMRFHCLTALASLDEAASSNALVDLLACEPPDLRYGAFRALREVDPRNDACLGVLLSKSYWLHVVAPGSPSLIHMLGNQRAEIVLFGKTPRLVAPFSLRVGPEIVITARPGDNRCTISRYSTHQPERQEQCTFAVGDVITKLAEIGALYEDVAQLLKEARDTKCLSCDLAIDALPKEVPIQKLAENAHIDRKMDNEMDLIKSATPDQAAAPAPAFDRAAYRH